MQQNTDAVQLPASLPSHLASPLTELGSGREVSRVDLDSSEVQAIEEALAAFKALEIDGQEISRDNFTLPSTIQEKLFKAALDVHQTSGVSVIRGLDPVRYSDADNLLLFLGIANFIGDKHGIQDSKRNVISHVTDAKAWAVPYEQRHGVHTNRSLTWHCDMGADVLALQVRQVAAEGGATLVASSWKVYNDLMSQSPDVVRLLAEPNWPVHMSGRKGRYTLAPLLAFEDKKLLVNFDPSRLGSHPAMKPSRSAQANPMPALTETQLEALTALSAVAEKNSVQLDTIPGDLVFINNWAVMHSRSAYVDADGTAATNRRHLLRLWLRSSELGWKIPESLRAPWESAFGYTDEGYISGDHDQVAAQLKYAVVPQSSYKPARYTTGSAAFIIEDSESESSDEY